jgi:hypothetical protein
MLGVRSLGFFVWFGVALASTSTSGCVDARAPYAALEDAREARCRGAATPADAKECFAAGAANDRGAPGRPVNHNKAMALWQIGCKSRQDDRSCTALVRAAAALGDDRAAMKRATLLFDDLCRSGRLVGCVALADAYEQGRGAGADEARALELDEQACFHGVPAGDKLEDLKAQSAACTKVSSLLSAGIADPARATAARTRAVAADAAIEVIVVAKIREAAAARAALRPGASADSKDARWTSVEETPALGCASAKMTAAQTAQCEDWSSVSSGACSCTAVGPQFACTVDIRCH